MIQQVFNAFDKALGPYLYHKGLCTFAWKEGPVDRPWLAMTPQKDGSRMPNIEGDAYIQRTGFTRWAAAIPAHWPASLRTECHRHLDYFLRDIPQRYPPNYVVYHCGTTANVYSRFALRFCQADKLPDWHQHGPRF